MKNTTILEAIKIHLHKNSSMIITNHSIASLKSISKS